MTMKQVLWASPGKKNFQLFIYIETDSQHWWGFSSILQFCDIVSSPSRVLKQYGLSKQATKSFFEFSSAKPVLPKKTVFVSTSTVLEFLTQWQKKQRPSMEAQITAFKEMVKNPQGTDWAQPPRFRKEKKSPSLQDLDSERSQLETTLLSVLQTSLTSCIFVQEILTQQEQLTLTNVRILKEFQSQVNESVEDLAKLLTKKDEGYLSIDVLAQDIS